MADLACLAVRLVRWPRRAAWISFVDQVLRAGGILLALLLLLAATGLLHAASEQHVQHQPTTVDRW